MANVKITPAGELPIWDFMSGNVEIDMMKEGLATFVNTQTNYVLRVKGEGFEYDSDGLADGLVKNLTFVNETGQVTMRLRGDLPARELREYLMGRDPFVLEDYLFQGQDKVTGSGSGDLLYAGAGDDQIFGLGGDDEIHGGIGRDLLTGGPGHDVFHFRTGGGKDTITDFDANGGFGRQDYIVTGVPFEDIEIRKAGDDVLVDLGGGDVVRLLDVKLKDINGSDFIAELPI